MLPVHIRPFTSVDYPAIVALWNTIYLNNQLTVDELRDRDARRAPHILFQRFVVEHIGKLIAYGQYDQRSDEYHPQKFVVFVGAAETIPWSVRHALGTHLLTALQPFQPIAIYAIAREDMPNARLYPELGFSEAGRMWESWFDPTSFDHGQVAVALASIHNHNYHLCTLHDLAVDAERDRKLYELVTQLEQDVPRAEPYTPCDFATFQRNVIQHPDMIPEAYIIACYQHEYVGVSSVWQRQGNDYLETDLTGVRRDHRRRGLAHALKLSALQVAAQRRQVVKTWNDATNAGILALNKQVGFVRQPPWIDFVKHIPHP